jgi:hypothetical protein
MSAAFKLSIVRGSKAVNRSFEPIFAAGVNSESLTNKAGHMLDTEVDCGG